jgi:tetratricopeptide (TPR) repeat protein
VAPFDKPGAIEMHRKALAIDETLAAGDPQNASLRFSLVIDHALLGDVEAKVKDRIGALGDFRTALAIMAPLSAADPANGQYRSTIGAISQRIGAVQVELGDPSAAMTNLGKSLAIHDAELAADPSNVIVQTRMALAAAGMGTVYALRASAERRPARDRIRDWREARSMYQRAFDVWEDLRKRGSTTGDDAARPAGLAREIAGCDAALARLKATP